MRVLVCGGRDFTDRRFLSEELGKLMLMHRIDTLIHGDAAGADRLAGEWGQRAGITVLPFPADWVRDRRAAGPIRNKRMLDEGKPDLVVAFPGGKGTANMVAQAKRAGVPVRLATKGESE